MRDILAREGGAVLARFARSRVLMAFDFDGTLAPIVEDPGDAAIPGATRLLLARVAAAYPCAVISGRSVADLRGRLRGVPLADILGNHGLEPSRSARRFATVVRGWLPSLREELAALPGVAVEDKSLSVAVHYRRSRARGKARAAVLACAGGLGPLRVLEGKLVVNLLPVGAPHKGTALVSARDRHGCDRAVFVGDDETDEDVFALGDPGWMLGIRVGRSRRTKAGYYLRRRESIDALLRALVALRSRGGGR